MAKLVGICLTVVLLTLAFGTGSSTGDEKYRGKRKFTLFPGTPIDPQGEFNKETAASDTFRPKKRPSTLTLEPKRPCLGEKSKQGSIRVAQREAGKDVVILTEAELREKEFKERCKEQAAKCALQPAGWLKRNPAQSQNVDQEAQKEVITLTEAEIREKEFKEKCKEQAAKCALKPAGWLKKNPTQSNAGPSDGPN